MSQREVAHVAPAPRLRPLDALGLALAVLTCVIWGTNGLGAAVGTNTVPPWTLAACRAGLGCLILLGVALARGARWPRSPESWWRAALVGLLQTSGSIGLMFWAIQRLDSGLVMVLVSTQPFIVAHMLLRWSGGEQLGRLRLLTLCGGFLGVALVAYAKSGASLRFDWFAIAVQLLGAACWAGGTLAMRRPGPGWTDVTALVAAQLGFGTLVLALAAIPEHVALSAFTPAAIGSVVYLAIFTTAITFTLWQWLIQRYGASRVTPFVFLMPTSGVVLGAALLGEPIPPLMLPGLVLVALGVGIGLVGEGLSDRGLERGGR
jgi:drug/metabolite transporter (DMT)-like permease